MLHCTVVITLGEPILIPKLRMYFCLVHMIYTKERKTFLKNEQKIRDAAAKSTDTRGVGISSMSKSIYIL